VISYVHGTLSDEQPIPPHRHSCTKCTNISVPTGVPTPTALKIDKATYRYLFHVA